MTDDIPVFLSYARSDGSSFAEELAYGLRVAGFRPTFDREHIAAGEDWKVRIAGLIAASESLILVITPAALRSKYCAWELAEGEREAKRIIPIVAQSVDFKLLPPSLARRNLISFESKFAQPLSELAQALRTDIDWIREHTRIAQLAARWSMLGRPDDLLLRGAELDTAGRWVAKLGAADVQVTDLQREFISQSQEVDATRLISERIRLEEIAAAQEAREDALQRLSRRTALALWGTAGLTAASGGFAVWAFNAEKRADKEMLERLSAERNSLNAFVKSQSRRSDIVGQLVAYGASPGEYAADGPAGGNSPYTRAVLESLNDQNASLQDALSRAHTRVVAESTTGQRPYLATDLNGPLYLNYLQSKRRLRAVTMAVDSGFGFTTPNTRRDVARWSKFLRQRGFRTVDLVGPSKAEFVDVLDRLTTEAKSGGLTNTFALLVYAGIGVIDSGVEKLVVRNGATRSNLGEAALPVEYVRQAFKQISAASALILDTDFASK